MEENTGRVILRGKRDLNILVISLIITSMGLEHMYGQIKDNTVEVELIIRCMGRGNLLGGMGEAIKENMKQTKNTATEPSNGQMVAVSEANG